MLTPTSEWPRSSVMLYLWLTGICNFLNIDPDSAQNPFDALPKISQRLACFSKYLTLFTNVQKNWKQFHKLHYRGKICIYITGDCQ